MYITKKEACALLKITPPTLISNIKSGNIPTLNGPPILVHKETLLKHFADVDKICLCCGTIFKCRHNKKHYQKYCSSKCREKDWIRLNPEQNKLLKDKSIQKSKEKNPVLCKECGIVIPLNIRRSGLVFCSNTCKKERHRKIYKKWVAAKHKKFSDYKKKKGCSKCGYNKCGGCLDYHHINPKDKQFRITVDVWKSSERGIKIYTDEINKCVLLCKNCHYEEHNLNEELKDNMIYNKRNSKEY